MPPRADSLQGVWFCSLCPSDCASLFLFFHFSAAVVVLEGIGGFYRLGILLFFLLLFTVCSEPQTHQAESQAAANCLHLCLESAQVVLTVAAPSDGFFLSKFAPVYLHIVPCLIPPPRANVSSANSVTMTSCLTASDAARRRVTTGTRCIMLISCSPECTALCNVGSTLLTSECSTKSDM